MPIHAENTTENASQRSASAPQQAQAEAAPEGLGMDMRPEAVQLQAMQDAAGNNDGARGLDALQMMADNSAGSRRLNTEAESLNAKANINKLQGHVKGTMDKVGQEFDKAQGLGNATAIKWGMPELRENAVLSSFRKRLTGNDTENGQAFVKDDTGEVTESDQPSKHQLSDDEKGGLADYKDTSDMSQAYQDYARKHIEKFTAAGAHAFISNWAYGKILNEWKNWGQGTNFVSPRPDADALLIEACDPGVYIKEQTKGGISYLEKKLGIGIGDWSDKGTINIIYRFIVVDPQKFLVRLPTGTEGRAFQKEWLSGGKTLGGGDEAVINSMNLNDLKVAHTNGAIEIRKVQFLLDSKNEVCGFNEEIVGLP